MPGLYLDRSLPSVRALCRHLEKREREKGRKGGGERERRGEESGGSKVAWVVPRGGGGHGHLEHDTEKPNEGDMERPATTHANLQIRSVKVRH